MQEKRDVLRRALDGKTIQGIALWDAGDLELTLNGDEEEEEVKVTIRNGVNCLNIRVRRSYEVSLY